MIAQLQGQLLEKQPPLLLLDIQGVGYEVSAPMSTFYHLPDIGEKIKLFTQLIVREDAHTLYGFLTKAERHLFKTLLKVNGVGPRLALTILSSITPEEFVHSILNNDAMSLVSLPGIGKKTAERLIIEMRDKLTDWQGNIAPLQKNVSLPRHQALQDAISALITLGYKQQDANRLITRLDDGDMSTETLIRLALKEIK